MIYANLDYIPNGFTFLISGGIDSVSAAYWLRNKLKKSFNLLHFNHNCQQKNEDMEQRVKEFAKEFNFKLNIRKRPVYGEASESELRDWRLSELQIIGGNFVTAHHLDDAVENYLMNCFHGKPENIPISWKTNFGEFVIFHPFLRISKKRFELFSENYDLLRFVVEDPSNKNQKHKRNWIRHSIVNQLNERQIGIQKVVVKKFYI